MDWPKLRQDLQARVPGLMDASGRYAVLVPLVEGEALSLLYEVRSRRLRRQPGEVCFPGGKIEGDESPEQCALRETWEELGIPQKNIHILGRLDFIAHRANFIMYPILARVDREALDKLALNPDEVEEVFRIPVEHLLSHPPLEYSYTLTPHTEGFPYDLIGIPQNYRWQPGSENVPVYLWENRAVWGLTGRITRHLTGLLQTLGDLP